MKMKTVVDAASVLQKLAGEPLSIRSAYRLTRLIGKINEPLAFYDRRIAEITEKYFDTAADGTLTPKDGCQSDIDREVGELLALELEQEIEPVSIPETENATISAAELMAIAEFVKIEEEP